MTLYAHVPGQPAREQQVGGDHYLKLAVRPWDALRAWMTPEEYQGFLIGSAMQYLVRWRSKGGLEDIEKALHYLTEMVDYSKGLAGGVKEPKVRQGVGEER